MDWHVVGRRDEVTAESPKAVTIGDRHIGLFEVVGEVYAIENVCTHQFALLTEGYIEEDAYVECPLHQARFHIPTGKTMGPPADRDVATYPVRITDGQIAVGVSRS